MKKSLMRLVVIYYSGGGGGDGWGGKGFTGSAARLKAGDYVKGGERWRKEEGGIKTSASVVLCVL